MNKYIILIIISLLKLNFTYSQSDSGEKKITSRGTILYFGDYFFFLPKVKAKKDLEDVLKSLTDCYFLRKICYPEDSLFTLGFKEYSVNETTSLTESKWHSIYIAEAVLEYQNINSDLETFNFDIIYKKNLQSIKTNRTIYSPKISRDAKRLLIIVLCGKN
jgi:hypothetical protein